MSAPYTQQQFQNPYQNQMPPQNPQPSQPQSQVLNPPYQNQMPQQNHGWGPPQPPAPPPGGGAYIPAGFAQKLREARPTSGGSRINFDKPVNGFARVTKMSFGKTKAEEDNFCIVYEVLETFPVYGPDGQPYPMYYPQGTLVDDYTQAGRGKNSNEPKPFWGNVNQRLLALTGLESEEWKRLPDTAFSELLGYAVGVSQNFRGFVVRVTGTPNKNDKVYADYAFPKAEELAKYQANPLQTQVAGIMRKYLG